VGINLAEELCQRFAVARRGASEQFPIHLSPIGLHLELKLSLSIALARIKSFGPYGNC
jgi:hypothetical protein